MFNRLLPALTAVLLSCAHIWAQPKIQLVQYATGFNRPVDITHAGDNRLFIVEQGGKIWILDSTGNKLPDPFLDIDARVRSTGNEQGLLGLAFHPDYANNGYFYVNYTRENDGDTRVSRFSRKPDDPNLADPDSELILMEINQPYSNHNGGCIKFGPDGYLYIGLGDGGNGGDPQNYGQKKNSHLGKILRIDVNGDDTQNYLVPPDNPFINDNQYLPEIWSLGWRNPWRFSFDRLTGDMWVGDVGQNAHEEIDFEPAGLGGLNYGWRCYEGNFSYNLNGCLGADNYVFPVFDYANPSVGCSVTGGFIYRGTQYSDLYGVYLNADYCSGRWWATRRNADGTFNYQQIANLADYEFSSFGEDLAGELYVAALSSGRIYHITELCSAFQMTGEATAATCNDTPDGAIDLTLTGGAGSVEIIWSNGANTEDLSALTAGTYIAVATDDNNCVRRDTFVITSGSPAAPVLPASEINICSGASFSIEAPAAPQGFTYQWYLDGNPISDANSETYSGNTPGQYTAQLIGAPCNSAVSAPVTVNEELVPSISGSTSGDTISVTELPGFTYTWSFEGTILSDNGAVLVATQTGNYQVTIVSPLAGCTTTLEFFVEVVQTKMPEVVRSFSLAPNPTAGMLSLRMQLQRSERVTLSLSDATQKQIFMQQHQKPYIEQTIDLRVLPAGTYYLRVSMESGEFVRKVVKQ